MNRPNGLGELNDAARRVTTESGGVLSVDIVRPIDFLNLVTAALTGDSAAARLVRTAGDAVIGFGAMPPDQPALCACCPRPLLSGSYSVAVVTPACDAPGLGLALGICTACATDPDDLLSKAREGLTRLWPNLRPVAVTHPSGSRA